ncbi:uncharacterized protein MONBRDRAFT_17047 [Monosiga brevicollis MX1]|uniref:Thioredoxin domain-containing protein n=1 Tax=Monosiga brevicollis TaxID=81824 RepID=A9UP72_MONBE|nr:uncharacterized protein MONBRDRAFT_17047 [Monosiga brevicollis MX1]EDQ92823.1 predicted protein [Monosiga brevicollis MX1]|eukprot:XP_001742585.1 hypothetical protein [Monosiga brevicollis MX1]
MLQAALSRALGTSSAARALAQTLPRPSLWVPRLRIRPSAAYSTAPKPSQQPPTPNLRGNVGRGGPISWTTLAVMLGLGGAAVYYFDHERQRVEKVRAKQRTSSVGQSALGGDWTLTDMHGEKRHNTDFLGQWHLLYFGFTFCPDVCPEELDKMAEVINHLDAQSKLPKIQPLFVSVDPDRDTLPKIQAYVEQFHPRLLGLTGTHEQIKHICKKFRVYYSRPQVDGDEDYLVDHSIIQYLMDPEGHFVAYYGQNMTAEQMLESVQDHIREYNAAH